MNGLRGWLLGEADRERQRQTSQQLLETFPGSSAGRALSSAPTVTTPGGGGVGAVSILRNPGAGELIALTGTATIAGAGSGVVTQMDTIQAQAGLASVTAAGDAVTLRKGVWLAEVDIRWTDGYRGGGTVQITLAGTAIASTWPASGPWGRWVDQQAFPVSTASAFDVKVTPSDGTAHTAEVTVRLALVEKLRTVATGVEPPFANMINNYSLAAQIHGAGAGNPVTVDGLYVFGHTSPQVISDGGGGPSGLQITTGTASFSAGNLECYATAADGNVYVMKEGASATESTFHRVSDVDTVTALTNISGGTIAPRDIVGFGSSVMRVGPDNGNTWRAHVYDISTDIWTEVALPPFGAVGNARAPLSYYQGGVYSFGAPDGTHRRQVWRYDVAADTWDRLNDGPSEIDQLDYCWYVPYASLIYVFAEPLRGGNLWTYDPESDLWEKRNPSGDDVTVTVTGEQNRGACGVIGSRIVLADGFNDILTVYG